MTPQIPWLRVFVEGVVIVGSILLAFGIVYASPTRNTLPPWGKMIPVKG